MATVIKNLIGIKGEKMRIVVIGSGPGGLAAAGRAAELGAEVTVIEKEKLGGVCLNEGCIPTKKLLDFAKNFLKDKELQRNPRFSWQAALCEKENLIEDGENHILGDLELKQIKLIRDEASFQDTNTLQLKKNNQKIKADKIIIATGSSDTKLRIFDYNQPGILTSRKALNLKEIPKSLLIVGGGVIGLEFATLFQSLNTKVTIVEMMETLLPGEDIRIVKEITQILKSRGIEILTQTKCQKVLFYGSKIQEILLSDGQTLWAEKILVAVGRIPNSKALKPERAGIQTDQKGFILTDEKMETNVKGIYAVGDVAGQFFLAPVAELEGKVAAENALGNNSKINYQVIPRCIFTIPQIGICGLNSDKASGQIKIGRAYFKNNAEAQIRKETKGFLQIIADGVSDKILGAQIIGPEASLLIQEIALAMKSGLTCRELAKICKIHPSLAEIIPEAAKNAERR